MIFNWPPADEHALMKKLFLALNILALSSPVILEGASCNRLPLLDLPDLEHGIENIENNILDNNQTFFDDTSDGEFEREELSDPEDEEYDALEADFERELRQEAYDNELEETGERNQLLERTEFENALNNRELIHSLKEKALVLKDNYPLSLHELYIRCLHEEFIFQKSALSEHLNIPGTDPEFFELLLSGMQHNSVIKSLKLTLCDQNHETTIEFAKILAQLTTLQELELYAIPNQRTKAGREFIEYLIIALQQLTHLRSLKIYFAHFSEEIQNQIRAAVPAECDVIQY